MKLSNETKVGVLAVVAILVLVFGFNFLKGSEFFSKPDVLYARFSDVGSLEKSNQVKINGLPVGTVSEVRNADQEVDTIIVEIHLTRDVKIPRGSIAFIDATLLGSPFINIEKPTASTTDYLESGEFISTRLEPSLIGNIQSQLAPTITRVNQTLDSLRIAIGAIAAIFDPATQNNMQGLIANLTVSSIHLQQLLNTQTGALSQAINNLNSVSANLARNNDAVSGTIRNVEVTTAKLANANIEGTINALQSAINEMKNTVSNLNSKDGSLGLLMNDRALYDRLLNVSERLNSAALAAEITIDDLRANPKRYLNFSVFGGKQKDEPLSSPLVKDTVPVENTP